MSTTSVLALAFGIGVIAGLRSLTAPAVVSWAAHQKWINLAGTHLAFLGSSVTAYILTALAIGELVTDKLPRTPGRKAPLSLIFRMVTGAVSGAALCMASQVPAVWGVVSGALGSLAGTFGGYELRTRMVRSLKVPDFVIALLEDAVAIVGALWLVTRL
jgi:uncharacterized membrane protein